MARSKITKALNERLKQEHERERQEELRQQALERRQEEDREQAREEERRQEALQQAKEFEDALEAAEQKHAALLAQLRAQKRAERKHEERQTQHRAHILNILREANHQEVKQEEKAAEKQKIQRQAALQAKLAEQQEDDKAAKREAARRELARQEHLEEQRQADKDAEHQAAQAAQRQQEAQQERSDEQRQADKAAEKRAEQQEAARQERLQEQRQADKDAERQADQAAQRRQEARQERADEQRQADKADQRQEAARQEQREAQQATRRRAEQQEVTRREHLQAQRETDRAARQAAARRSAKQTERQAASRARQAESPSRNPMEDSLSSAALSGSLPWLRVNGNLVTNLNGDPILLRGVNLLGFDSAEPDPEDGFAAGAGLSSETFEAIQSWGANVIRVAINRSRVLAGSGDWSAEDYLSDLDWIVSQAAGSGMYTLLSLRRLDEATVFGTLPGPQGAVPNYIAPQPDADSVGMWRVLGERYANEPAVLFDLYTSPHAALPDDITGFYTTWELWTLWVRLMVADLRQGHPRALCFVSGLDWGADLSGFPVIGTDGEAIGDLVYTAHIYPQRPVSLAVIQALSRKHPLFVTEWGGEASNLGWGERIARALRSVGVGWTAAHWNAEPVLVQSRGQQLLPTRFGSVVYRELALEGVPLVFRTNTQELINATS